MSKAFYDATCPKCKSHIGWFGRLTDRPACKCGHQIPRAELDQAESKMEEFRTLMATSPHKADGETLRKQRLAAGLTLGQAVKVLGVSGLTLAGLSRVEQGVEKPSERLASAMAKAYGLDAGEGDTPKCQCDHGGLNQARIAQLLGASKSTCMRCGLSI